MVGSSHAPTIPSNVATLNSTFNGCTSLRGEITINTNKIQTNGSSLYCFRNVDMTNVTLTGEASIDILNQLGSTGKNWTPLT